MSYNNKMEQPQQHLLHFSHSNHPLLFYQDYRGGYPCHGCQESVYGPAYYCGECELVRIWWPYRHHKSCAELPLGLHHPLHPIHPLILFDEKTGSFLRVSWSQNCILLFVSIDNVFARLFIYIYIYICVCVCVCVCVFLSLFINNSVLCLLKIGHIDV